MTPVRHLYVQSFLKDVPLIYIWPFSDVDIWLRNPKRDFPNDTSLTSLHQFIQEKLSKIQHKKKLFWPLTLKAPKGSVAGAVGYRNDTRWTSLRQYCLESNYLLFDLEWPWLYQTNRNLGQGKHSMKLSLKLVLCFFCVNKPTKKTHLFQLNMSWIWYIQYRLMQLTASWSATVSWIALQSRWWDPVPLTTSLLWVNEAILDGCPAIGRKKIS